MSPARKNVHTPSPVAMLSGGRAAAILRYCRRVAARHPMHDQAGHLPRELLCQLELLPALCLWEALSVGDQHYFAWRHDCCHVYFLITIRCPARGGCGAGQDRQERLERGRVRTWWGRRSVVGTGERGHQNVGHDRRILPIQAKVTKSGSDVTGDLGVDRKSTCLNSSHL